MYSKHSGQGPSPSPPPPHTAMSCLLQYAAFSADSSLDKSQIEVDILNILKTFKKVSPERVCSGLCVSTQFTLCSHRSSLGHFHGRFGPRQLRYSWGHYGCRGGLVCHISYLCHHTHITHCKGFLLKSPMLKQMAFKQCNSAHRCWENQPMPRSVGMSLPLPSSKPCQYWDLVFTDV